MEVLGIGQPRRIITGTGADNKSYFARVEEVGERGTLGEVIGYSMWAADKPAAYPLDGKSAALLSEPTPEETPEALRLNASPHPGLDGFRANLIKFPPAKAGKRFFADFHWHDTLDLLWVIAGELTVGLEDGSEQTARPGDLIVQHGTNHYWRSGPDGAVVGLVMLGATRVGSEPPKLHYEDHSSRLPEHVKPMLLDRLQRGEAGSERAATMTGTNFED
jgi:quercetin dioxygenase-like cupin family protein